MRKLFLILTIMILNLNFTNGQAQDEYIKSIKRNYHTTDIKEQFIDYNFSGLIFPNQDFLGFIGSNYKRIKIFYNSVVKDESRPYQYNIKGLSVVGTNKCDFSGELTIKEILESKRMELGVDLMYESAGFKSQGIMIADYQYNEDRTQKHVGKFSGRMILWWLIDKHGILHINDVNNYSDSYKNNQHVGTWTEYGSTDSKTCNWGVRRIPNSGDLDIGAGEFSVNPKYKNLGWEFYRAY